MQPLCGLGGLPCLLTLRQVFRKPEGARPEAGVQSHPHETPCLRQGGPAEEPGRSAGSLRLAISMISVRNSLTSACTSPMRAFTSSMRALRSPMRMLVEQDPMPSVALIAPPATRIVIRSPIETCSAYSTDRAMHTQGLVKWRSDGNQ